MLDRIARQTRSLRVTHPKVKAPHSIFDSSIEEIGSLISAGDTAYTETTFDFDDLIVNSKVYRRVLSKARLINESPFEDSDQDPKAGTTIQIPPTDATRLWENSLDDLVTRIPQNEIMQAGIDAVLSDKDFSDELSAIEQWFRVLSPHERSASVLRLLQTWKLDASWFQPEPTFSPMAEGLARHISPSFNGNPRHVVIWS